MPKRSRSARAWITALSLGPALALLIAGAASLGGTQLETSCWILPNARLLLASINPDCPLHEDDLLTAVIHNGTRIPFDSDARANWLAPQVDGMAIVEVMNSGLRQSRSLPVRHIDRWEQLERLLSALLLLGLSLAIPMCILWTSIAPAATPIALTYGLVAVVGVGAIIGRNSPGLTSATVLAASAAPSVLLHLALVFPRKRAIVRAAPALLPLSYVPLALFAPLGMLSLHVDPAVWPAFVSLLLALTGAAWLGVVASCAFAVRESRSQLEWARARALCLGAALLPIPPTLWLANGSSHAAVWAATYIGCATVTLPIPIGLAITSYNLFDVGWHTRRGIGRSLYLGAAAALIAVAMRFGGSDGNPSMARAFALALFALVCLETLRTRLLALVDSMVLPHVQRLRREREDFTHRVVALRDEDEVAQLLAGAVQTALRPASGCVALRIGTTWRVASTFGPEPTAAVSAAPLAAGLVSTQGIAHLAQGDLEDRPGVRPLLERGIELVATVRSGPREFALLVISARDNREPYTGFEVEFVRTLCSHSAAALENSRMATKLLAAERRATSGRIAVALAHDLGKELAWIGRLAERLPTRANDTRRLGRDADQIAELADAALQELQDFVEDSTNETGDTRLTRIDEIVELAVRQIERHHDDVHIAVCIDPTARAARAHGAMTRVLANALENGVLAAGEAPVVTLSVRTGPKGLHLEVRDTGSGMSPEMVARACEAGFTSRRDRGGLGIGLTAARDIVVALGGSLAIESVLGQGTTVSVDLPAAGTTT